MICVFDCFGECISAKKVQSFYNWSNCLDLNARIIMSCCIWSNSLDLDAWINEPPDDSSDDEFTKTSNIFASAPSIDEP